MELKFEEEYNPIRTINGFSFDTREIYNPTDGSISDWNLFETDMERLNLPEGVREVLREEAKDLIRSIMEMED